MTDVPDRTHVDTERRHPASSTLDLLDTEEAIQLMIADHRTVADAVEHASTELETLIDAVVAALQAGGRLIYIGAGTSGRLGVLDASECPPTFRSHPDQIIGIIAGGDTSLRTSSEAREDDPDGALDELTRLDVREHDMLVGIAAGGTTPYVLGALDIAARLGADTGLITCAIPPRPLRSCRHLIILPTGPEILTGSTRLKAGSATKLVLNMITTLAFAQLGKVHGNLMIDLRATNDKLTDRAIRSLMSFDPGLTRPEANTLLHEADGNVKTAIVMRTRQLSASDAQAALERSGGHLRPVLDTTDQ